MINKRNVPAILILLILITGTKGFGQEGFSSFISRLRAETAENRVIITWQDSADLLGGKYLVYRHTSEITDNNFKETELLEEIAPGTEVYVDYPPPGTKYFYAVLIKDRSGKIHEIFVPFRNKTTLAVSVKASENKETQAAVTELKVRILDESSVELTFTPSQKGHILNIYSSTKPIVSIDSLLSSTRLAAIDSTLNRYVDFPLPGIPYYYAIIYADQLKTGNIDFYADQNSTASPIELPITPGRERSVSGSLVRGKPLPFYNINRSVLEGSNVSASPFLSLSQTPLSSRAKTEIDKLLIGYRVPDKKRMEPVLLPSQKTGEASGEQLYLKDIIQKSFSQRNWNEAELSLKRFLRIKREKETENAARFYLGQVYFFQGRYRESFLEFLLVQGMYREVSPWLDRILQELRSGN